MEDGVKDLVKNSLTTGLQHIDDKLDQLDERLVVLEEKKQAPVKKTSSKSKTKKKSKPKSKTIFSAKTKLESAKEQPKADKDDLAIAKSSRSDETAGGSEPETKVAFKNTANTIAVAPIFEEDELIDTPKPKENPLVDDDYPVIDG